MSIVNFSISKPLEQRIAKIIKEKGFSSKAEFFRFSAIYFIDIIEKPFKNEDEKFSFLADRLATEISQQYRGKKIPSVEQQLSDL